MPSPTARAAGLAIETGPAGTGPQFQFAFAFVLPLVAAILAEVAFRGVMQGGLHAVLGPWAAILGVAAVSTAAHRWEPDLAAHSWQNFVMAVVLWQWGPFDLGAMTAGERATVVAFGVAALAVTVAVGRGSAPYRGPPYGYAAPRPLPP
jgi:membrane protease YdiL (CAAX protease family)